LDVEESVLDGWISGARPIPANAQLLIAGILSQPPRELFTDLAPEETRRRQPGRSYAGRKPRVEGAATVMPAQATLARGWRALTRARSGSQTAVEAAKVLIGVVYDEVTYPNFKSSVKDPALHDMYALWWSDHRAYQDRVGNPAARSGLAQDADPEDLDAPFFDGVRQQRPKAHHD
jgi:hypothetical protein